jgi:hypothetical protein
MDKPTPPTTADFEKDAEGAFKHLLEFDFDTIVKTLQGLRELSPPARTKLLASKTYFNWLYANRRELIARVAS